MPVTVILELEWVLRSRYAFGAKRVAKAMQMLTTLNHVVVAESEAVRAAAARVDDQGWDFADALHHALCAGCDDFVTFESTLVKRGSREQALSPAITGL